MAGRDLHSLLFDLQAQSHVSSYLPPWARRDALTEPTGDMEAEGGQTSQEYTPVPSMAGPLKQWRGKDTCSSPFLPPVLTYAVTWGLGTVLWGAVDMAEASVSPPPEACRLLDKDRWLLKWDPKMVAGSLGRHS